MTFATMEHKKRNKSLITDLQNSACDKADTRFSSQDHGHGAHSHSHGLKPNNKSHLHENIHHSGNGRQNQVGTVMLFGVPIVSLVMEGKERLCLAQISSTLLKEFSYNEIHNRRVALGITCIQCTPVQLEILRRAGAMPVTSRRCGMITRREAERLCQSFLGDHAPPQLPENFAFNVFHECAWGCRGAFVPARYNSSRAKCIRCSFCQLFFSPNKFIFHSHRLPDSNYVQPDAANFNSWRRHLKLCGDSADELSSGASHTSSYLTPPITGKDGNLQATKESALVTAQIVHAWEDVKAMFNGGTRKRLLAAQCSPTTSNTMKMQQSSNKSPAGSMGHGQGQSHPHGHGHGHNYNNSSSRAATPQTTRQPHFHSMTNPAPIPSCATIGSTPPSFMSPVLPVTSPLLGPAGIWNPGISPSRGGHCNPLQVPAMPLSIHPLSIPWLRRPLFPFSHPFGPTCKFLGGDNPGGGLCGGESCGVNSSSSAFKPVGIGSANVNQNSSNASTLAAEHLFSTWLTNSVGAANSNAIVGATALPEDLSVNSSVGSCSLTPPLLSNGFEKPTTISRKASKETNNLLSPPVMAHDDESSDDENVDIESTEIENETGDDQFDQKKSSSSSRDGPIWNTQKRRRNTLEDVEDTEAEEVDTFEEGASNSSISTSTSCPNNNHSNGSPRKLLSCGLQAKRQKKRLWDFDRRDD